ncbi:MAG TPA: MBL fold metallo-hydrolase [Dehalococcoidales bacterium]|nr:MBL fold metallo-hydrolase [Dehalococcoidales bacterium]
MATEITPGIFELFIPMPDSPLEKTNVYFLRDGEDNLLIDTGWNDPASWQALEKELRQAGSSVNNVRRVLVTHAHPDHYGLVTQLKKVSGATIYLHREEEKTLRTRYQLSEKMLREGIDWFFTNGVPREEMPLLRFPHEKYGRAEITEPDIMLVGDEIITVGKFKLRVIWTPGHSPGHVCLYDADRRFLFSGDHVLPVITPNIGLLPGMDNPLGDFTQSLNKLRNLSVETVLPAHERRFHNLPKRIDEIIRHHETRNREILGCLQNGPLTAYQVSQCITWMPDKGGVKFYELNTWARVSAVSETLAHLRAMAINGTLKTITTDGIISYALNH